MRLWTLLAVSWLFGCIAGCLAGCGDNNKADAPDAAGPDAPPAFAEADHGNAPQVMSGGGIVLAAPKVQPIFFANDAAAQAQVEAFLGQLAGSSYWTATTAEYGVGPISPLPTIVTTDAPPVDDPGLQTWLAAHLDGTHTAEGWPGVPDPNTIYSVFLPVGTPFAGACTQYGAYHDESTTALNAPFSYALMPRCVSMTRDAMEMLTSATSHELIEAATDPLPFSAPAYVKLDSEHFVWGRTPGGELGDMCEYVQTADQKLVGDFIAQRTWSNVAAAAGHDPCVPAADGAYLGVAPVLDEDIMISSHGGNFMTKGITVPVGMSKTIDVQLFSDAAADDWTVTAYDAAVLTGTGTATLSFQWGKQSGHNGDKLRLIVTRTKANSGGRGSEMVVASTLHNQIVSMWWGYVAQ
jgi:hypothetical protein